MAMNGWALEPELMQTLLGVARESSFTRAAERLNLTQQAVSAQMKRLETIVGRRLVDRSANPVRLTNDGEVLALYARQVLEISEQVRRHFAAIALAGSVRLGIVEGFASTGLPVVLSTLRRQRHDVEIYTETAESERLVSRFDAGHLDVVLAARRSGQARGEVLWSDSLRWIGNVEALADPRTAVRLVVPPAPSLLRDLVCETLAQAGRPFTVIFESDSRTSLRAAALADFGVGVFCNCFDDDMDVPQHCRTLPELGEVDFFLLVNDRGNAFIRAFADLIRDAARTVLRSSSPDVV